MTLTVTTSLLEIGSRGLQLYDVDLPLEDATGGPPGSLSQPIMHSEMQPESSLDTIACADFNLVMDGSCGDPEAIDVHHDPEHRQPVTPTRDPAHAHATDGIGRSKRLQVGSACASWWLVESI